LLEISRRVEYALRAAAFLAARPADSVTSFREIAASESIPANFLAKILRDLVDAGIARSSRGAAGGFSLARPPEEITFLEILEAADSPISLNDCTFNGDGCVRSTDCRMAGVFRRAEGAMLDVFRRTTLRDIAATEAGRSAPPNGAAQGVALGN
jgi:Rrf2 family protein